MLLGTEAMDMLSKCSVAVFGLGGVGSFAAEALVRAGIGSIALVDHDVIGSSNINRQIHALHSTLGIPKTQAMANRVLDINPDCRVIPINKLYSGDTREEFFFELFDYVIDAIDLVSCKLDLVQTCINKKVPIISAMGTGNKLDPSKFEITDISLTSYCPLARIMRKELKKRGILHHTVLYSAEPAVRPLDLESPPPGRRSIPASVSWVPAAAGLMLAGHAVTELIKK